jgi:hypothetical protein
MRKRQIRMHGNRFDNGTRTGRKPSTMPNTTIQELERGERAAENY